MKIVKVIFTIFLLLLFFILESCSAPKIEFAESKKVISNSSNEEFLNFLKAKDTIYSVVFFTSVFEHDSIEVKENNKILFADIITSVKSLGLAKTLRINNTSQIKITDVNLDYSFNLKQQLSTKYKYIYIQKKKYDNNRYVITYSNTHRAFY